MGRKKGKEKNSALKSFCRRSHLSGRIDGASWKGGQLAQLENKCHRILNSNTAFLLHLPLFKPSLCRTDFPIFPSLKALKNIR